MLIDIVELRAMLLSLKTHVGTQQKLLKFSLPRLNVYKIMRWAMCRKKQKIILWHGIGSIINWKFFSLPLQDVLIKRLHQKTFLAMEMKNKMTKACEWNVFVRISNYAN
jgi:hypothetical protein